MQLRVALNSRSVRPPRDMEGVSDTQIWLNISVFHSLVMSSLLPFPNFSVHLPFLQGYSVLAGLFLVSADFSSCLRAHNSPQVQTGFFPSLSPTMRPQAVLSLIPLCFGVVHAGVTVYGTGTQAPLGIATSTSSAASANYTGSAAYNPTVLNAPAVPDPKPPNAFNIQLQKGGMSGMSMPIPSSFFGFSVEFSVANQVRM